MKPDTTPRPFDQKAGSAALSPNGASNSLCRLVPPAFSMSRYFSAKPALALLIDRIERVHQAIAEGIGIDVERHMDEMRDIGPLDAVLAVLLGSLTPLPKASRWVSSQISAMRSGITSPLRRSSCSTVLEVVHGDLAHDGVQHVLDLAGQQDAALRRIALALQQRLEGQHLAEHRGGFGQRQRRIREQLRPAAPAST